MSLIQSALVFQVQNPGSGVMEMKWPRWWTQESGAKGMHLVKSLTGARLENQLFAFMLMNQVINFVQEVIVPFLAHDECAKPSHVMNN